MMRAWLGIVIAAGVLCAGGCSAEGGVELSWQFAALPDGSGGPEPPSVGCGRHGVDSVLVTGASDAGDGASIIALCTAGGMTRKLPVGTWEFALHTIDVQGRLIRELEDPEARIEAMEVAEGATTVFPIATIPPRPACSDGVDNDHPDGNVDLADPDCSAPDDTDELAAPQP